MSDRWTKGPWSVDDFNADDLNSPVRFDGPAVVYAEGDCDVHPIADCSCNHTCRGSAELYANARLISAAPDMAEALDRALNYLLNTQSSLGIAEGSDDELTCTKLCRAALAKARGQA